MASKLLEDELTSEGDVVDLLLEDAIDADGNDIAMLYAIAEIARIDPESAIKLLKASIQSLNNPKKPIRYTLRYGGLGNASEKLSEVAIAMSRGSLENMNEFKSTDPELAAQFRERIVRVDTVAKKLSMREGFNALDLFADKNLNDLAAVKSLRISCANMLEKVQEIKTQSDKVAAEDAIERVRGAFGKIATNVGLQLNPLTRTVMAAAMVPKSTADIIQQKRSEGRGGLLSFGQATSASFPRAKNERWPAYETGGQIPPNRALEVPISSSALTHSTHGGGIVKCGVCYGTIKTGLPIDTCNGCHATYHSSCAERVVNIDGCPVCTVKEKHRHSDIKSFGKREMSLYENIYSYMSILDNFGASAGINAEDFKRDFEWVQRHHSDGKQSTVKKMTALHKTLKSAFNSVSPSKISKLDYSNVLNQFNEEVRFLEQKLSKGSRFRRWWFSRRWGFGKEKNPVIDKEKGMQYIDHLEKDLAYLIGQRDEMKKAFEHNPSDIFRMIGSAIAIANDLKEVYYTDVIKRNVVQAVAIASVATVIGVTAIPALYNSLNNGSKPSGKPVPANPNNNTTSNATPNGATVWKAPSVNPNFQTAYPILYNTAKAIFDADDVFTGKVNVSVQGNNVVFMNNGSHEVFLVADTAIGNYQIKVTGQDYGLDAGVDVWVNISAPDVPDKSVSLEVILNNTGKVTKDAKYSIVANPPAYDMNNRDQFIRSGKFYLIDNETKEILGETDLHTKDGKINTQGAMRLTSSLLAGKEIVGKVNITTATGLVGMSTSAASPDVPYQISDSWVKNGSFGFKYDNPDAGLEASIQYTLTSKATGNKTVSDLLVPVNGTNMVPNVAKGLPKGEYDFSAVDLNTGKVIAEGQVFQKGLPPEASGLVNGSVVHDFLKDGAYKWTQIANLINEPGDVTHYKWVFDINGEQKETVGSTTDKAITLEEVITAADVKAAGGSLTIKGRLEVWDNDSTNGGILTPIVYEFNNAIFAQDHIPISEFASGELKVTQGYSSVPIHINASDPDGDIVEKVQVFVDGSQIPIDAMKDGNDWYVWLDKDTTGALSIGQHKLYAKALANEKWSDTKEAKFDVNPAPYVEVFKAGTYIDIDNASESISLKGKVNGGSGFTEAAVILTDGLGVSKKFTVDVDSEGNFDKEIPYSQLGLNISSTLEAKVYAEDINNASTNNTDTGRSIKPLVLDDNINRLVETNYDLLTLGKDSENQPDPNAIYQALVAKKTEIHDASHMDIKEHCRIVLDILDAHSIYADDRLTNHDSLYKFGLQFIELFKKSIEDHVDADNPHYYPKVHFVITEENTQNNNTLSVVLRSLYSNDAYTHIACVNLKETTENAVDTIEHLYAKGHKFAWDSDFRADSAEIQTAFWRMIGSIDYTQPGFQTGAHNPQLQFSDAAIGYLRNASNGTGPEGYKFTDADEVQLGKARTTIVDLLSKTPANKKLAIDYDQQKGLYVQLV